MPPPQPSMPSPVLPSSPSPAPCLRLFSPSPCSLSAASPLSPRLSLPCSILSAFLSLPPLFIGSPLQRRRLSYCAACSLCLVWTVDEHCLEGSLPAQPWQPLAADPSYRTLCPAPAPFHLWRKNICPCVLYHCICSGQPLLCCTHTAPSAGSPGLAVVTRDGFALRKLVVTFSCYQRHVASPLGAFLRRRGAGDVLGRGETWSPRWSVEDPGCHLSSPAQGGAGPPLWGA